MLNDNSQQGALASPALLVSMRGVSKSFNGVRVLVGADFDLVSGEVHAVVGGNGAGKSTLMKILEGVYSLDAGEIRVGGELVHFSSGLDARRNGVAMIFQEFSLVPTLSVAQNVFLGREPKSRLGTIRDRESERACLLLFKEMAVDIDPRAPMSSMPTAYWQLTEIAKALAQDARVIIMDEPTSSLAKAETQALFSLIRRLKDRGMGIVYISHRLEEVLEIADRVTFLRDGKVVATEPSSELTTARAIELIVGRKMGEAMTWRPRVVPEDAPTVLEVEHLSAGPRVSDVSFSVRAGEVIGLAGLMGSGRSELARVLFGIDRAEWGTVRIKGRPVRLRGVQSAIDAGIALIPEDRRVQGLVLDHTVRSNLTLTLLRAITEQGVVRSRQERELAERLGESLNITAGSLARPVRLLSGGNQQKVVIAKWLGRDPDVLIMDEPTVGVDVGTKGEIVEAVRHLAEGGKAVIMISSEFPELLAVADRILLVHRGTIAGDYDRRDIADEEHLLALVQAA